MSTSMGSASTPFFLLRGILHLQHPRSPLSSTRLVRRAFFSPSFPDSEVRNFEQWMSHYESLAWPIGMMRRFTSIESTLRHVSGWRSGSDRVVVIAGGKDRLMSVKLMRRIVVEYHDGAGRMALTGVDNQSSAEEVTKPEYVADDVELDDGQDVVSRGNGVRFCAVGGAGHHLMNDLQLERGAEMLVEFLKQL